MHGIAVNFLPDFTLLKLSVEIGLSEKKLSSNNSFYLWYFNNADYSALLNGNAKGSVKVLNRKETGLGLLAISVLSY